MTLGISSYSSCSSQGLYKNGSPFYENRSGLPFGEFVREAYRFMEPGYAKFFKMDELCKLAFLTAELLLSDKKLSTDDGADVALVIGNKHSSIASDLRHHDTYQDREHYFPSPAVFVYTLPNIMLGELCIRHQITGENSCFVMDRIQTDFLFRYVQDLFEHEHYQYCIMGWVDYDTDHYQSTLLLIEKMTEEKNMITTFGPDFIHLIPA